MERDELVRTHGVNHEDAVRQEQSRRQVGDLVGDREADDGGDADVVNEMMRDLLRVLRVIARDDPHGP